MQREATTPMPAPTAPAAITGLLVFASELQHVRAPRDVLDLLDQRIAGPLGLRAYAIWRVPADAEDLSDYQIGKNVWVHRSVPANYWAEFWPMVRKHGPSVLARMAWLNNGLFTWTETARKMKPAGTETWIFDLTRKHGLRDGTSAPVGQWVVACWSKHVLKLNRDNCVILYAAAVFAIERIGELLAPRNRRRPIRPSPELSPRELAVLRNYAIGKDMHEIAETLGVGEGTVKTFFTRVQRKLKAKHRGHAVHLAMREHLISYYALLTVGTILT